jgi:phosphate transport system permease protein
VDKDIATQTQTGAEGAAAVLSQRVGQIKRDTSLRKRPRPVDDIVRYVMLFCGMVSIFTTIAIVIVLGNEALRFFTSREYNNTNKLVSIAFGPEDTTIYFTTSGRPVREGQIIRIDQELMRITQVVSPEEVVVIRGIEGTTPVSHGVNATMFVGDDITLWEFLTNTVWQPQASEFGVLPLLNATLMSSAIGLLVAVPLGLGSAIYLSEYASQNVRAWVKPILEILAGIPTVVFGFFALNFMTPVLRGLLGQDTVQLYNVASAGIVMGIAIIPLISSMSEDALSAVPRSLREASYGLGATKLETTIRVLIPSALSGLVAAFIVGMSRAVGETMIMAIAAGAGPRLTFNPFQSAETIAGHMVRISTGDISYNSVDYNSLFALGLTLFIFTLVLNTIAGVVSRRFREAYQ